MKNQKQFEYLRKVYFKETYPFLNEDLEISDEECERYYELVSNEMVNFIWDYYKYLKTSPEETRMMVNQQASSKLYLNIVIKVLSMDTHYGEYSFPVMREGFEDLFRVVESFTRKTKLTHLPGIDKDIVINYLFNIKNLFKNSKHIDRFIIDETMQDVCEHFLDGFIKKYFEELKGLKELTGTLEGQWDLKWK